MENTLQIVEPSEIALVVVTFNRSQLLRGLLESIGRLATQPGRVFIVDNASVDDTEQVVERFATELDAEVVYQKMVENTGGSGGFSEGMRLAYESGATWVWLMDDDVEVLEDAIERLQYWGARFRSVQGRRYDYDGSAFYWQYRISVALGIPIPWAPASFEEHGYRAMNSGCFEGMFIHRDIVRQIGLPDPRFFIYWDDTIYGWLASRVTESVAVEDFILRRTRSIRQWDMGVRHLNASSDMYRYYIMRNRGIMRHYFASQQQFKPVRFAFGTFLTFCKEVIRLVVVERKLKGFSHLFRGMRDARRLARDREFAIMPALT